MRIGAILLALLSAPAWGADCRDLTHEGTPYTVCTVDPATQELRLFLNGADGQPYYHFSAIDKALAAEGKALGFAMNAGMFHDDYSPVGHYIENGAEQMRVIPNAGPGNFGLLPNGVLCLRADRAEVIETLAFLDRAPVCRHATQSGPMLVIDGDLHPRFLVDSTSRYIRNGVGLSPDGKLHFAISNRIVNFHAFGRLFRDVLNTPNALYLDGKVSRLYAPDLGRSDFGFGLGPIIGTVVEAE